MVTLRSSRDDARRRHFEDNLRAPTPDEAEAYADAFRGAYRAPLDEGFKADLDRMEAMFRVRPRNPVATCRAPVCLPVVCRVNGWVAAAMPCSRVAGLHVHHVLTLRLEPVVPPLLPSPLVARSVW